MGYYGSRLGVMTGDNPEGSKLFGDFVYNDASLSLTIGMPLYVDVTDAAEQNDGRVLATTKLSTPAVAASGGKVVLGTNANAGVFIGVFQPDNPNSKPNKGDGIKVCAVGRCLVSAAAKSGGTSVKVNDALITDASQTSLLSGGQVIPGTGLPTTYAGQAVATTTHQAPTNVIIAVPGSGTTTALVNGYVRTQ